jgi:tetratricopeptide (TPR) repeat protein
MLPDFVVCDGQERKLRRVVRVLTPEDVIEVRGSSERLILCGRYRQDLNSANPITVDMEWTKNQAELGSNASIVEHTLHSGQHSNHSVWVSATKSINTAVKMAGIFHDLALLDTDSPSYIVKDLEKENLIVKSDQHSYLAYARLLQEVLIYKEAKVLRVFRNRIPPGGCKIWPPNVEGEKNLFPPTEDFEGRNFDEKFERQLYPLASPENGLDLIKWKGSGGYDEKWFILKRIRPSARNRFALTSEKLVRHHLRLVWAANESARALLSEGRTPKDQSVPVVILPCRLYEFQLNLDEEDFCGSNVWQDSFLLFALEVGDLKIPHDLDCFKGSQHFRNQTDDEALGKVSCEDICRMAILDSLLGIHTHNADDMCLAVDRATSKAFAFRIPSFLDSALGSTLMQWSEVREDLRVFHDSCSTIKLLEELCSSVGSQAWRQKPGWFDQGDRGKLALIKHIKEMFGDVNRSESDSSRNKKFSKVLMYMRHLDTAFDDTLTASRWKEFSYEDSVRCRARVLSSLVSKLERRDFDSDLSYLSEAAKSVLKEELSLRLIMLLSDPLPTGPSDRAQMLLDFDCAETAWSSNAIESLAQDLQGVFCNVQIGTSESLRIAVLNHGVIHVSARASISDSGMIEIFMERPQRDGVDRMNLGIDKFSVEADSFRSILPSEISSFRVIIFHLLFNSANSFKKVDFDRAFQSFLGAKLKNLAILVVDAENPESSSFLKGLYENLKKGSNFQDSLRMSSDSVCSSDLFYPSNVLLPHYFETVASCTPWKTSRSMIWKGSSHEDRSRPAQIEYPTLLARMDWTGNNPSIGRNEELHKMVQGLDTFPKFLVSGGHFEDVCAAAYELFRFCSQRSWKGKILLAKVEGVLGDGISKRDVVRILCRESEDEPVLCGDDAKRSGQSSRAERRFSDESVPPEEDPDDDLSTLVRQSGVELYIIVDGTGVHGARHSKLAELVGFAGDSRNRIVFGDRQKVVLFSPRQLKGFQGHEIRLHGLAPSSTAAKEFFCKCWKRVDDPDQRKRRPQDRAADMDAGVVMFNNICGGSADVERYVIRFLARLGTRDLCKFSVWMQERSEVPSVDAVTAFLFDTLRPEEQGAFLALTVFEGRFDNGVLNKIIGKWEDCAEAGFRATLLRSAANTDDEQDTRKKIQWALNISRGLIDGINPDSKKSGSSGGVVQRQFQFHEVVMEKLMKSMLVSKTAESLRRADDRVQYFLPDHVREWGRSRLSEICKVSSHLGEAYHQRRCFVADYISDRLLEAGGQSSTSLNTAWDLHQHDWFRLVNILKDSEDTVAICRLSKLVWSVVLGNNWNSVFSRFPKAMFKSWAERSAVLKDDLLETSVVIAFARLEFIKACCDLEYKDKESYEPALKILEFSLDALEQNWSALAPYSVDFNNNVVDYYLCKAEILGVQGLIRSWIRKDPKEKDALRLFEEAILSCFGGRTPMEDEHILHKVLLAKIHTNVGSSLRSVGHRELKHYQKKESGKRKRGALDEILNYFKHADDCFEKAKELCFRQNVYNRNQLFGEKYHDIFLSKAHHNLALCKLGMAKTLKQIEGDGSGDADESRGALPFSVSDLLRDAREAADRALSARVKWGQRGTISLQIEALNSRVVLCTVLYELPPEDRDPDWREIVSRVRRLVLDDISSLKEKKRADLMTHSQRSALRSARKEADKVLGVFRELFEEDEGVHMADSGQVDYFLSCPLCCSKFSLSGEEDETRRSPGRRRGSRDRGGDKGRGDREGASRQSWSESAPVGGNAGGGGGGSTSERDSGWGGWSEGGGNGGQAGRDGSGGWGGWVEGSGAGPPPAGGGGDSGGGGSSGGRPKGAFFHVPVGERRYRRPEKSDQPAQGGARGGAESPGAHAGSDGSPPPSAGSDQVNSARSFLSRH